MGLCCESTASSARVKSSTIHNRDKSNLFQQEKGVELVVSGGEDYDKEKEEEQQIKIKEKAPDALSIVVSPSPTIASSPLSSSNEINEIKNDGSTVKHNKKSSQISVSTVTSLEASTNENKHQSVKLRSASQDSPISNPLRQERHSNNSQTSNDKRASPLLSPSKKGIQSFRQFGSKIGNLLLPTETESTPFNKIPNNSVSVSPLLKPNIQKKKSKKSLLPTDAQVIHSRKQWLEEEKSKMADTMAQEWEAIFKDMAQGQGKNELTKSELMEAFKKMGKRIDEEMINKVFVLFDANGDGVVDLTEFMVAMLFLSYRGSAKDNVELAFRLFDTNRSGDISKREFSEMISSIVGTSVPTLLKIDEAKKLFRENLQQEFAAESLNFIDEISAAKAKYPPATTGDKKGQLPVKDGKYLVFKYVVEGAPEQININDSLRKKAIIAVKEAERAKTEMMDWDDLLAAEVEVVGLLEKDKLPKFKKRIRNSMTFADDVWKSIGIKSEDGMTIKQFRLWSSLYPGIFSFLDDMQQAILQEEKRKAAALKIQRARRRAMNRRGAKATAPLIEKQGSASSSAQDDS